MQAERAYYEGNYQQQAMHLLQAGQWNHAHSVIIDHLAADDIIIGTCDNDSEDQVSRSSPPSPGETASLHHMLTLLSDHSSDIQNWDNAGSVSH